MSRVAKTNIKIPDNVSVKINDNTILIKGKKGSLKKIIHPDVKIKYENNTLSFSLNKIQISNNGWAQAGTTRSLINSMIEGVSIGFEKKLQLVGVGYKVNINNNKIILFVGFSHTINYLLPENITAECPSQNEIIIKGIDKQIVKQIAAIIRSYKRPDPYKGKGIRYENEFIRIKESKKK